MFDFKKRYYVSTNNLSEDIIAKWAKENAITITERDIILRNYGKCHEIDISANKRLGIGRGIRPDKSGRQAFMNGPSIIGYASEFCQNGITDDVVIYPRIRTLQEDHAIVWKM